MVINAMKTLKWQKMSGSDKEVSAYQEQKVDAISNTWFGCVNGNNYISSRNLGAT